MQGERPLVRTQLLRTFVVHAMAREARWSIEAGSLIRPPAIDAHVVELFMDRPITTYLSIIRPAAIRRSPTRQRRSRAWIAYVPRQAPAFQHCVQHHLEVLRVQLINHLLRFGKILLVPRKLSVVCVPSRRREVRA